MRPPSTALSLYGSSRGPGCPLKLAHARLPAFYGGKRGAEMFAEWADWRRGGSCPATLVPLSPASPSLSFQVLSAQQVTCSSPGVGAALMIWIGRSVHEANALIGQTLHSELTDTLVAPRSSNTLSLRSIIIISTAFIQLPLEPVWQLLNNAFFFFLIAR